MLSKEYCKINYKCTADSSSGLLFTMPIPTAVSHLCNGQVEITTEQLILRAARVNDVSSLYETWSDPEVVRYW